MQSRVRFLGFSLPTVVAGLSLIEAAIFFAALIAAALMRFEGSSLERIEAGVGPLWPRALLFSSVMLLCFSGFGLYSARQRARTIGIVVRMVVAAVTCLGITAMFFYLVPNLWIGRGVLGVAVVVSLGAVGISRMLLRQLAGENAFKRRVLVYGVGHRATTISGLRRRTDRRGFLLIGFIQPPGEERMVPIGQQVFADGGLLELCDRYDIDDVVVAMEDRRRGFPTADLLACRLAGVEVIELPTFLERETGRVRIDALNPSWMIFGSGFRRDVIRLFSARVLDLATCLLLIVPALPVMLLTALAIKLEDGWAMPVLYRQERVGIGGRTFHLLKFRSMCADAERGGRAMWAQLNDSRVTRVGSIIRKLRIDELPQIFNVLGNDMSFVGPRPERPMFVAELAEKIPYYAQRQCVKPGITGWAQVCYPYGASERDALEKLQYDLYYIKNNCLLFDLSILVQTAEVVLMGKGAR